MPHGTDPKHPSHPQHLTLTPQTLHKVQGDPEHPLSHPTAGPAPAPTLQHARVGMREPRAWQKAPAGQPGSPPPLSLKPAGSNEKEMPRRRKSREKQRFWMENRKASCSRGTARGKRVLDEVLRKTSLF